MSSLPKLVFCFLSPLAVIDKLSPSPGSRPEGFFDAPVPMIIEC